MTTALQTTTQNLAKQLDYSEDFVQTVKDVYAKGATDTELKLFLQTAKRTGLDPLARQIYCIKRYDSSVQKSVMSTQVSIDGFRVIADRTGNYVPSKEPTYTFDENGNVQSATAYLKKLVGGQWHEVSATAFYDEYVQTTREGSPNSVWKKMPRLMLAKCAESLLLRKAFPAQLSGLYTSDEMGTVVENEVSDDFKRAQYETYHEEKELPVETDPHENWTDEQLKELKAVCEQLKIYTDFIGYTPAVVQRMVNKMISFDTLGKCWDALEKVAVEYYEKLSAKITEGLSAQDWDAEEIESYLAQHDVTALIEATRDQLEIVYADMKDSKMI